MANAQYGSECAPRFGPGSPRVEWGRWAPGGPPSPAEGTTTKSSLPVRICEIDAYRDMSESQFTLAGSGYYPECDKS